MSCDAAGVHAHHLKMIRAMGARLKVSDEYTVPLCPPCHDGLHRFGDEQTWWDLKGVDPVGWALRNWRNYNDEDR